MNKETEKTLFEILSEEFSARQGGNASFSLRSFARTLGISPALLSMIFNRRTTISKRTAILLSKRLGLDRVPERINDPDALMKVGGIEPVRGLRVSLEKPERAIHHLDLGSNLDVRGLEILQKVALEASKLEGSKHRIKISIVEDSIQSA